MVRETSARRAALPRPPDDCLVVATRSPPAGHSEVPAPWSQAPFITVAFSCGVEVVLVGGGGGDGGGANLTVQYTMADPWGVAYSSPATLSGRFTALSFANFSSETGHSPSSGRLQASSAPRCLEAMPCRRNKSSVRFQCPEIF